jgi:hypothetical protein
LYDIRQSVEMECRNLFVADSFIRSVSQLHDGDEERTSPMPSTDRIDTDPSRTPTPPVAKARTRVPAYMLPLTRHDSWADMINSQQTTVRQVDPIYATLPTSTKHRHHQVSPSTSSNVDSARGTTSPQQSGSSSVHSNGMRADQPANDDDLEAKYERQYFERLSPDSRQSSALSSPHQYMALPTQHTVYVPASPPTPPPRLPPRVHYTAIQNSLQLILNTASHLFAQMNETWLGRNI